MLTLKVLNFWKCTSYCSLKPLWSGMGEVVPARTSPTLHPPSPPTVHQLLQLALLRVNFNFTCFHSRSNNSLHLCMFQRCPWNAHFHEMRADVFLHMGDLFNAASDIRRTTKLIPDNTAGYLKLSNIYYEMGDAEQSLTWVMLLTWNESCSLSDCFQRILIAHQSICS